MRLFRTAICCLKVTAVIMLLAVTVMLKGCGGSSGPSGETLRFVFMADSRGDSLDAPIKTPVLNAIIAQIATLSPQPSFVIFGGDMAYRGFIDPDYTFQTWKDLFAPLTNAGVTLYTTVGNHELYHEHSELGFFLANQQAFQNVFSENPGNGPPGYEQLAYSFTSPGGTAFFAVLDPYYLTADVIPTGLGGNIDGTQLSWLSAQVTQTTAIHKFLFIHTPYYYITNDPEEPSDANESYTNLWAFLDGNQFDFYACGHQHLYSRKAIDSSVAPNPQLNPPIQWENNVVQLLNGAAGAGPDTSTPTVDRASWNVLNAPGTYYFTVVDINGNTVTVNTYGGNTGAYSVVDTFTIVKNQ